MPKGVYYRDPNRTSYVPPYAEDGSVRGTSRIIKFDHRELYSNPKGGPSSIRFYLVECTNCQFQAIKPYASLRQWGCRNCSLLPKGEAGFRRLFHYYHHTASRSKREFTLTQDQVRQLTSSACYYCGAPPCLLSECNKNYPGKRSTWGDYPFNGLDRYDNSLGYTTDNTVPCCHFCNRAKNSRGADEFIAHIVAIHQRAAAGKMSQAYADTAAGSDTK